MKITAGILFYLLDRAEKAQHICHGADRMPLERFEWYRKGAETGSGVLYLSEETGGIVLFCGERSIPAFGDIQKILKSNSGNFSSCLIPYGSRMEDPAVRRGFADELSDEVRRIWFRFTQIQNGILEDIFEREEIGTVMAKVRGLLREPFTVVDRDMLLLYQSPDVPGILSEKLGANYAEDLEEELLVAKEFHTVAKLTGPFYYHINSLDQENYCINILEDGYYYARLVVQVADGKQRLESGAEQISEYLADMLVRMIRQGSLPIRRKQDDLLHRLCFRVAGGARPEPSEISEAIAAYGWSEEDDFQVFCLEPYHAKGWETQIENTIPLITRKIEQTWPQSCAAYVGRQIFWIIDHSQAEKAVGSYELRQQLVVFLRENVLRAGGSSLFHRAALMASAFAEAAAALKLGSKNAPSSWFHRFDDHRLEYMIEAVRDNEIEPELLVHPALPRLLAHDAKHDSHLFETLKVLAEKQGNVTQASDALFIHRTTLFRRLNQIRELTGLDPDAPETLLELQISFRIL